MERGNINVPGQKRGTIDVPGQSTKNDTSGLTPGTVPGSICQELSPVSNLAYVTLYRVVTKSKKSNCDCNAYYSKRVK